MKKAKIIVPALALLALSVTASITGTVAWFTVASTASAQFAEVGIAKLAGKLASELTAGNGTQVITDGSTKKIVPAYVDPEAATKEYVKLTHASYDVHTGKLYSNTIGSIEEESSYQYDKTTYFAFDFTITFTYDFGTTVSDASYNLYFNFTDSSVASSTGTPTGSTLYAVRGFRMAFTTDANEFVWSPWQNKTLDQNSPIINSCYCDSATTTADYTTDNATGDLIYMGDPMTAISGSTGGTARKDYLGTFSKPASGTTDDIAVTVTMWFEGNDNNISEQISDINALLSGTLDFYLKTAETVSA